MTRSYIGVWREPDDTVRVESTDHPESVLGQYDGRISPLLAADGSGRPFALEQSGVLVFLTAGSPAKLLAAVMNDLDDKIRDRAYVSHGHSCLVVSLAEESSADELLRDVAEYVTGWEIWPHIDGRVDASGMRTLTPAEPDGWKHPTPIDCAGLGFEAAAQVRQFNSNIVLLSRIAGQYAPELEELVAGLHGSVSDVVRDLVDLNVPPVSDTDTRRSIAFESVLVEVNAVVTLYCSQLGSGSMPLVQIPPPPQVEDPRF